MNERIQELIPQAYELVRKNHGGYFTQELLLSCMAELIVRECASLAYDGPGGILDYFGVEE